MIFIFKMLQITFGFVTFQKQDTSSFHKGYNSIFLCSQEVNEYNWKIKKGFS